MKDRDARDEDRDADRDTERPARDDRDRDFDANGTNGDAVKGKLIDSQWSARHSVLIEFQRRHERRRHLQLATKILTPPSKGKADLVHQPSLSECVMPEHLSAEHCKHFDFETEKRNHQTNQHRAAKTKRKGSKKE